MNLLYHIIYLPAQYRIGQLYMIARHSAEESKGGGDGVEVVVNEPCHDEKHGEGRYTEKRIYLTRYYTYILRWINSVSNGPRSARA